MKIFGNSDNSGQKNKPSAKKPPQAPVKAPVKNTGNGKKPDDNGTKILIALAIVLVVAAIGITGYALVTTVIRPPQVPSSSLRDRNNDETIINEKDGDEITIAETGDRVADYFTVVVGAVDEDETRTDALMVCGFDTNNKKINILNIPRDTMSDVSRRGASKKINAAYGTSKGIEQTKAEVKKLTGFTPDYYMIVNFQGIADIVDAIGGVDYEVPFRMYYTDPTQNLHIDFQPGMTHMSGKQVVEFLRWRKNNGGVRTGSSSYTGSDEDRIAKQQEFLKYLAAQILAPSNISKIPAIAKAVFSNVKTDFTMGEMLWMGMQAVGLSSENLQMHTLPGYSAYSYAGTGTQYSFFFPDEQETLTLINEYFNPYVKKMTSLDIVSGPSRSNPSGSSSGNTSRQTTEAQTETEETTQQVSVLDPEGTSGGVTENVSEGSTQPSTATGTTGATTEATTEVTTQAQPSTEVSAPNTQPSTAETPAVPSTAETPSEPSTPAATTAPAATGDPEA